MTAIKTIGILGAGQLGRMIAIAAAQMGIRAHIFAPDAKDSPAAEVAQTFTQANYDDADALAAFGRSIDAVTSEFENVPATTMDMLSAFCPEMRRMRASSAVSWAAESALMSSSDVRCLSLSWFKSDSIRAIMGPPAAGLGTV